MNYIQRKSNLPLGLVFKEDKNDYFEALIATRRNKDITIFRNFMHAQYQKFLLQEIDKFKEMQKPLPRRTFSLIF